MFSNDVGAFQSIFASTHAAPVQYPFHRQTIRRVTPPARPMRSPQVDYRRAMKTAVGVLLQVSRLLIQQLQSGYFSLYSLHFSSHLFVRAGCDTAKFRDILFSIGLGTIILFFAARAASWRSWGLCGSAAVGREQPGRLAAARAGCPVLERRRPDNPIA